MNAWNLASAAQRVFVEASPSSSGLTLSSGLVFAGGIIAALGAVLAAVITARAAEKRMQTAMQEERGRADQRLAAEADRIDKQLDHDRAQVRRSEAIQSIEQTIRLLTRTAAQVNRAAHSFSEGDLPSKKEWISMGGHLNELREDSNLLALRFGMEGGLVPKLRVAVTTMNEAIPWMKELPLSEERKEQIEQAPGKVNAATIEFLIAARETLENF